MSGDSRQTTKQTKITKRLRRFHLFRSLSGALLLACSSASGCRHEMSAVSKDPPGTQATGQHYAHMFGQRYRTKVDLYLFIFKPDQDYKYLGINNAYRRFPRGTLPAAISKRHIGRTYGNVKILDVVPAGSELTIEAETHEVTALSGIRGASGFPMGFICGLTYNGRQLKGILSEFIQSHKEVPTQTPNQEIDETIAVRIDQ